MNDLAIFFISGLIILLKIPSFAALNKFLIIDNSKLQSGRTYTFNNEKYLSSFLSHERRIRKSCC